MVFRVILIANKVYKKTLHRCLTRETAFINFNRLSEKNKNVKFPKKFINTDKILPVKYEICVTKPTESDDIFRTVRDDSGRVYIEKPIGDWTILASTSFEIEERFWMFKHDPKANRPDISEVLKKLVTGAYKKNMVKQVIVVHNKLIIYNEDQFDMVVCKCKLDAQRLHHTLAKLVKKQKIKSIMFMGTASKANIGRYYDLIQEKTKWPIEKIRRTSTRP
jgi:hypothetical protein